MNFGEALDKLLRQDVLGIRRQAWKPDVVIRLHIRESENDAMTAQYLYVRSRNGIVPWIPNMIEMATNNDWEVEQR